ncbi:2,3-bisphosphoglycerate-independent phosphoglycerate mutase [Parvibaculum lavamentivorans]|nr:2,3-bisphosphoglycerate-independent phosphoglycerate mutase [Parvibaculum lavamentivorans]
MAAMTGVRPLVLVLLDGWGVRTEREGNALATARTRIYDRLAAASPQSLLRASGEAVGLPSGKPGYAQAGYAALGAGRPIEPPAARITPAFQHDGSADIAAHPVLRDLISRVRPLGGAVHLIGTMTPSGISGHQRYLAVLAALLSHEGVKVWVHAVMDGQDTRAQSGIEHLSEFLDDIAGAENAELGSVMGRSFGFDDLSDPAAIAAAWRALANAEAPYTEYPTAYLDQCYRKGVNDDRIPPSIASSYRGIRQDDAILLVNLQADQAHGLLGALIDPAATGLAAKAPSLSGVYSLVRLASPLGAEVEPLFEAMSFKGSLAETIAQAGLSQLTLTETAAEASLWNFARGGAKALFPGETVLVTDTPPLAQAEKKPELASAAITEELLAALKKGEHDVITANFSNAAILGRTGNIRATVEAIEAIDKCLGKIAAQVDKRGGTLVLCGMYGKAEMMLDPETGGAWRGTTTSDAPLIIIGGPKGLELQDGTLADVAPTLLHLLGQSAPREMTGRSLIATSVPDRISA